MVEGGEVHEAGAKDLVRLTDRAELLVKELEDLRGVADSLRDRLEGCEGARSEETRAAARTRAALTVERDLARAELQRLRDRILVLEVATREAQERQRAAESRLATLEHSTGVTAAKQLLEELDPRKRAVIERGIARLLRWSTRRNGQP